MLQAFVGPKKLALVVEDDQDQRELLTLLLEETDFQVVAVRTADAGLAVMQHSGPNVLLVLTDVNLPGLRSGLDLAHDVADHWPQTKIIITSGYGVHGAVPEGARFLSKPWRALDILNAADAAVGTTH